MGRLVQINVNPRGGVPKSQVPATTITQDGVAGDKQRDLRYHGGPDRAVSLFSWELIRELQDEGHPIDCGTTGENLTIEGIPWTKLQAGARLRIGAAVYLELTSMAAPCSHIAGSFIDGAFKRISDRVHPGWSRWYARVLVPGKVHQADTVELEPAPTP